MITREEYNKALDIVDAFHVQLKKDVQDGIDIGKTLTSNWVHYHTCSTRLHRILKNNSYGGEFFIEDINKTLFFKFRNAGRKSWIEFIELRGY